MGTAGQQGVVVSPKRPRRLRDTILRPRWLVTIAVIALAAIVAALATVPVAQSYTFGFGGGDFGNGPIHFGDSWAQSLCPAGAKALVAFSSTGLNVTFGINAPNGTTIWNEHSPYANASFVVPTCGMYQLDAGGSGDGSYAIRGTLSYSAPIL
jgi:hypothetical protein